LIFHLITVSLWSSIENKNIHIMDIGAIYQEVINLLIQAAEDTEEFMSGNLLLSFSDAPHLQADPIYQKLRQVWTHDDKVLVILKVILPAIAELLQRIFADHLVGGKWDEASPEEIAKVRGLPNHNKFSESVFGHLDRLLREKTKHHHNC
jgi:hypothetical protein